MAGPTFPNENENVEAAAEAVLGNKNSATAKKKCYYNAHCPNCNRKGHITAKSVHCLFSTNKKSQWYKDPTLPPNGSLEAGQEEVEASQDNLNILTAEMENSQLKALYELTHLDSRGFKDDNH
jgi:hypothetical protein